MNKKNLPPPEIYAAWYDGEEIEVKNRKDNVWINANYFQEYLYNNCNEVEFRIKRKKQYRAWKPEEIPLGAIVRCPKVNKDNGNSEYLITGKNEAWVSIGGKEVSTHYLFKNVYEHSTDNGKTWQICGVLE